MRKKKNIFEGLNHLLTITHYKIPTDFKFDESYDPLIELTDDMVIKKEEIKVERGDMVKLSSISREVKKFNDRQSTIARELKKDYLTLKRIKKEKN